MVMSKSLFIFFQTKKTKKTTVFLFERKVFPRKLLCSNFLGSAQLSIEKDRLTLVHLFGAREKKASSSGKETLSARILLEQVIPMDEDSCD